MILGTMRSDQLSGQDKKIYIQNPVAKQELYTLGQDTNSLHLIMDLSRIGVNLFATKMEYTHFHPRSGKNHLFKFGMLEWPTEQYKIKWAIVSIPIEYRQQAEALITECGLRIADGIPHFWESDGVHVFPLDGKTVYTLENIKNHITYSNNESEYRRLKNEEFATIDLIFKNDKKVIVKELAEKGYSSAQIDRIVLEWEKGNSDYDETPIKIQDGSYKHTGSS